MKKTMAAVFAVLAASLCADEISLADAERAALNWIAQGSAPGAKGFPSISDASTFVTAEGGAFHRIAFAGGGFAVTAADDDDGPVIVFAPTGDFPADAASDSPLRDVLEKRFAAVAASRAASSSSPMRFSVSSVSSSVVKSQAKEKWDRLLGRHVGMATMGLDTEDLADVRVGPLVQSMWGQKQNSIYSNWGDPCYNYYTPNNYPCGCVATAMAQVMRYHQYPASAAQFTRNCRVDGVTTSLTSNGGAYDWNSMSLVPEAYPYEDNYAGGATEAQRQAIGKICYDAGVSACMRYASGGSGAVLGFVYTPLKNCFGYQNAIGYCSNSDIPAATRNQMMLPNFDAGYPVLMGVDGHAIIGDGYAYSGNTLYMHLNMGWSGWCDIWYAVPTIDAENGYSSEEVSDLVYNIFPNKSGDILSGRVLDTDGNPVEGATVSISNKTTTTVNKKTVTTWSLTTTATTDAKGIWAAIITGDKTYKAVANHACAKKPVASSEVTLTKSVSPYSSNLETYSYNAWNMAAGNKQMSALTLERGAAPEETQNTEVAVPFDWLDKYYPNASGGGAAAHETLAAQTGANGRSVWESYLLGLDPTNEESNLEVYIRIVDGVPVIEWNVTNENAASLGYFYEVVGKTNVFDGAWGPTNSGHRFFRVQLEKK